MRFKGKTKVNVGKRIEILRKQADMTQQQMADKLKISFVTYYKMENQADMKLSTIERIAKALGVTVHDIVCKRK